ncbi:MAG: hypothetical protein ACMVY4_04930 [Minwuia sp.]|uniref:hypothetical protein n=1 Tax=Minwuia sp. TaxID=2493630 RepID=UPI003A8B1833
MPESAPQRGFRLFAARLTRLALLLSVLAAPVPSAAQGVDLFELLEGRWDLPEVYDMKGDDCVRDANGHCATVRKQDWCQPSSNFVTISFSENRSEAVFDWNRPLKSAIGKTVEQSRYIVLSREPQVLTMLLEGETRKTAEGEAVLWQLRVLDAGTFCWRRTDWKPGACTVVRTRCP